MDGHRHGTTKAMKSNRSDAVAIGQGGLIESGRDPLTAAPGTALLLQEISTHPISSQSVLQDRPDSDEVTFACALDRHSERGRTFSSSASGSSAVHQEFTAFSAANPTSSLLSKLKRSKRVITRVELRKTRKSAKGFENQLER
jgi:hypothetical protein